MIARSLGYVKSTTPGTPIPLSTVLNTLGIDPAKKVHTLQFWPLLANTGIVFVGLDTSAPGSTGAAMNKSTGAGVLKQVQVPSTSGHQDYAQFDNHQGSNDIRIADFAIDVTSSGDGFAVFSLEN